MRADFQNGSFADRFRFGSDEGVGAIVSAWFSIDGPGGQVHTKTIYHGPTSTRGIRHDDYSTPFQPTALCKRSGNTDTLYVAGWYPRQRLAVIEEWTLQTLAIGETVNPGTGTSKPSLSAMNYTRRLLIQTTGAAANPIEALACDPFANNLLVLEYGPLATFSRIDLSLPEEEMSLLLIANSTQIPELKNTKYFRTGSHSTSGLFVILKSGRAWHLTPMDPVIAIHDVNGDGWLDYGSATTFSRASWDAQFPNDEWQADW